MLETLKARVNANAALIRRGRWVNLTFTLGIDDDDYLVTIDHGRISEIVPRRLATHSGTFAVRASRATWDEHWQPTPRRDFHDIWSMLPKGLVTLDGDLLPLIQNLQFFKDVLASLRKEGV
ncbi:MAG: hypothetical protein K0U93_21715 [Gammaproteobacteria bacterium]|nr:hypothetical protein [Gammaproteobacteria bacterium]